MELHSTQLFVFIAITIAIAVLTYFKCRKAVPTDNGNREFFLAGNSLSWIFVAGSITLTNLSTDQMVGMNGEQMLLLAWWELAAVVGLIILARVFLPIYYRYQCTTTTELLEKKYHNKHIRAIISVLFLLGNVFIYLPIVLYTGSLFMQSMFNIDVPIVMIAGFFAILGACYAILGGLRAVAVSDTFSGIGLLLLGATVVVLGLVAIDFDFSGIPTERLTLIGDNDSPIPWHTLLTGMIFIQMFYWSTNQNITQRAMASPSLKEAQRGVYAAAVIRLLIVPPLIVIPGIVAFKLYGDIGDAAFGRLVGDILPLWLSGAFAATIAAAVLTTFNSILNSSVTLLVCDLIESYGKKRENIRLLNTTLTVGLTVVALCFVPIYNGAASIIGLVQQLNGLLSMPILGTFLVAIIFTQVDARAAIASVIFGTSLYAVFVFLWTPLHYIHLMLFTLLACIAFTLLVNRLVFKQSARLAWGNKGREADKFATQIPAYAGTGGQ